MEHLIFGIGSRVRHAKFGAGVVIQVWPDNYEIVFMDHGLKQIIHGAERSSAGSRMSRKQCRWVRNGMVAK
ncbi:MAG: hypothetical protein MUC31_09250 [Bacteroidales bacterium]|nr:hypothetical protein [Bacteroidales bacterium]